jgi:uncharacterized protein YjdB
MHFARRVVALAALAGLGSASLASCGSPTGADQAASAVASVAIDPPSSTLVIGATAPLTALVQDASGRLASGVSIVWSVRDPSIASISQAGVVTGRDVGSTQVAASANGVSAVASVTVRLPPVASVLIAPDTRALLVGQSATFTATPRDANGNALTGRAVAWASSNGAVASVASTGVVTANAVGTATITATSEGMSANATVTVTQVPVASITLQPPTLTIAPGQSAALTATTKTADGTVVTGRAVTYASSNSGVARVSTTGVVTGVANGTAVITATSEGKSVTTAVTVQPAVSFVLVSPSLVLIRRGSTVQLSAAAYDANNNRIFGRTVTWSSDDQAVATVDANGLVTTKKAGTVLITATIDGKSDSSLITATN